MEWSSWWSNWRTWDRKSFIAGLVVGVLLAALYVAVMGNRYRIVSAGPGGAIVMRLDTWTGRSWISRYYNNNGYSDRDGTTYFWQAMGAQ